jgi:acyl-coenzyme A thioesterase PaaI-like protein
MTAWQRLAAWLGPRRLLKLMRFYPPLLGAGIRVSQVGATGRDLEVALVPRPWTKNYMGTAFGGSLYAMCDPFYMFLVIHALGPGHVVWDKSASIDFLRPGRGKLTAHFDLTDAALAQIRDDLDKTGKSHPRFEVLVRNQQGETVARVGKVLSVKKQT